MKLRPLLLLFVFLPVAAQAQSYPGTNNSFPAGLPNPPNDPPVWNNTPDPVCTEGFVSSEPYSQWNTDPDGDAVTFVNEAGCSLPTGVTINNTSKAIDCAASTTAGTTTSCVHSADDGVNTKVNSPSFSIVVNTIPALGTIFERDFQGVPREGTSGGNET